MKHWFWAAGLILMFAIAVPSGVAWASGHISAPAAVTGVETTAMPSHPLVDWPALKNAGLTGKGVTVEIDSQGLQGLQAAYTEGLLDPSEVTIQGKIIPQSVEPQHATLSAEIVHMIAPEADIYICNEPPSTCVATTPHGAVVAMNETPGITGGFAYGSNNPGNGVDLQLSKWINAHPTTLFYVSGTDNYGLTYTQGDWVEAQATPPGATAPEAVWNIGVAAGNADASYLALRKIDPPPLSTGKYGSTSLVLFAQAKSLGDHPAFKIAVYGTEGNLIAQSVDYSLAVTEKEIATVAIPALAPDQLPLSVYVLKGKSTLSGEVFIKLYGGNGIGFPYGWSQLTTGGVEPFMAEVGQNAFVVTGVCVGPNQANGSSCPRDELAPGMGIGPLVAFNTGTREFETFDYPTITGDVSLDIWNKNALPGALPLTGFDGTSNVAPELAATAALLLQAGLTPGQIEQTTRDTASAPASVGLPAGSWGAKFGYGIEHPLATLKTFVGLPTATIEGPSTLTLGVGQKQTFTGECAPSTGGTVTGYEWTFNDGTTASGKTVTHAWAKPDQQGGAGKTLPYTVRLNCFEKTQDGKTWGAGDLPTVTVNVSNTVTPPTPPTASFTSSSITATVGDKRSVTISCEPGSKDLAGWTLNWGDGSDASGTLNQSLPFTGSESHTWAKKGTYPATLTCTDSAGNKSNVAPLTVTVNPAASPPPPTNPNPPNTGGGSSGGGAFGWLGLAGLLGILGFSVVLRRPKS